MRSNFVKTIFILVAFACVETVLGQTTVPNPQLQFVKVQDTEQVGKQFRIYWYEIENRDRFPNELFAPAPNLPPCGRNTNASRTWLDFYDEDGNRLYGFCALKSHDDLDKISFTLERSVKPPQRVYVNMVDRQDRKIYKSNEAKTEPE